MKSWSLLVIHVSIFVSCQTFCILWCSKFYFLLFCVIVVPDATLSFRDLDVPGNEGILKPRIPSKIPWNEHPKIIEIFNSLDLTPEIFCERKYYKCKIRQICFSFVPSLSVFFFTVVNELTFKLLCQFEFISVIL